MSEFQKVKMLEFPQKGDERGSLIVVEEMIDIPFELKRIFYMYGSDATVIRGRHANKKTEFILINLSGQSKVKVKDGRGNEKVFLLDRPHTGIYVPKLVWKDMYDFSEDSILLCLASEHYDPEEYIRDYDAFVDYINEKGE